MIKWLCDLKFKWVNAYKAQIHQNSAFIKAIWEALMSTQYNDFNSTHLKTKLPFMYVPLNDLFDQQDFIDSREKSYKVSDWWGWACYQKRFYSVHQGGSQNNEGKTDKPKQGKPRKSS